MQIGIIGLSYAGKSTLFTTLLQHKSEAAVLKAKQQLERGTIKVPDERLDRLSELFQPRKTVPATVEYIKLPGLENSQNTQRGLAPEMIAETKTMDVLLLLVRAFENDMVPHPFERIDPRADIEYIQTEFIISDLVVVENRIARIMKRPAGLLTRAEKLELELLNKCRSLLERETTLREYDWSTEERKRLRGFQFLTLKPVLFVINVGEEKLADGEQIRAEYRELQSGYSDVAVLSAQIESEIVHLEPADQDLFLEELQIAKPALHQVIQSSYRLLGLMSFFTVGEDECRSWTIVRGSRAPQAAGAIHSDLERGFIRADVVAYRDLIREGSLQSCRSAGLLRLEGKEYVVQDGDVMEIRFNL